MGMYLNPGNSGFARNLRSIYVDKTGLISVMNERIDSAMNLVCVSRPRRFGKSYAAQMLCAYYDRTADSQELFRNLSISKTASYRTHLNQYNVLYIDMAAVKTSCQHYQTLVSFLCQQISREIKEAVPSVKTDADFLTTLVDAAEKMGTKFIMIIDEWDAPLRECPEIDREYLDFLRSLFKNSGVTSRVFAAVYMTGILPIKKIKTQSALSDFWEYTMLNPGPFAEYVGFTEKEVQVLCDQFEVSFPEMKRWYDGYDIRKTEPIYNPNSVIKALQNGSFDSYWSLSSAADNLLDFISRDVEGLRQTVLKLLGGVEIEIDTTGYNNDLTYHTTDAALTMLVHLGYLAYNQEKRTVRIPNEEIRLEFNRTIHEDKNPETLIRVRESDQLILDTIHGNSEAVAVQMKKIHQETSNPLNANREDSLRAAIQIAYFAYKDYYLKLEELPTGEGYADIVYLPKKGKNVPALIVELKWNKSAAGAIQQIKEKRYPSVLEGYGGELLLVGINYHKKSKEYECQIEKYLPYFPPKEGGK